MSVFGISTTSVSLLSVLSRSTIKSAIGIQIRIAHDKTTAERLSATNPPK